MDQYDDFYKICVSRETDAVTAQKLNVVELDGFSGRHSIGAAHWQGKTFVFGGQDVMRDMIFNELYTFNHGKTEMEKVEFLEEGLIVPKRRNSHCFVKSGSKVYVYGGANEEGPLNDAFVLDMQTSKFKRVTIAEPNNAPYFEMHTAHLYKGNQLLLIGGRSHVLPSQKDDPQAVEEAMRTPFRDTILSLDLETGALTEFAQLPSALAAQASCLIDDKYILIYGGTNGLRFFDNVIRYDIEKKEWTLLAKYPETQKNSGFFKDGRMAVVSTLTEPDEGDANEQVWVLFGGCSDTQDCNEFLVLRKSHLVDDKNFGVINEIL